MPSPGFMLYTLILKATNCVKLLITFWFIMESKCCLTQCLSGKIILTLVQFRIEFLLLFQNFKILQFANFLNKEKNDKFASLKKSLKLDVAAVLGTKVCRNHFMFKQHFILQRQFGVLTRPELI